MVGEYILKVYKHNLKLRAQGATSLAGEEENQVETAKTMNYMDTVDDQKKERDHDFIERLIGEYFSRKLLTMIEDMDVKKDVEEGREALEYQEDQDDEEDSDPGQDDLGGHEEENHYAKRRRQRERERRLQELRQWEFPTRIGSYNAYSQPALEFAKQLCVNVFGLEEAFVPAAQTLKRNILHLLHEKEFSPAVVGGT